MATNYPGSLDSFAADADNLTVVSAAESNNQNAAILALEKYGYSAYNVKTYGGAKGNGTTDDTTAIQNTINAAQSAGGGTVFLPAGTYIVSSPLSITQPGVKVLGAGSNASTIRPSSGFSGAAIIAVTSANGTAISDLGIVCANSTYSSNPAANGINVTTSYVAMLSNLYVAFVNGWGVQVSTSASATGYSPMLHNVFTTRCKGGIHILGVSPNTSIGATLTNCAGDQAQAAEAFLIEDAVDVQMVNCGGYSVGSGIASVHVKGGGFIYCTTGDFGASNATTGACFLLENSANTNLGSVAITATTVQKGSTGLLVNGGGNILVEGCHVYYNYGHGINLAGGSQIVIVGNTFINNNQNGAANTYDLLDNCFNPVIVQGNMFLSPAGSGVGQVAQAVKTVTQNAWYMNNVFGGASGANAFSGTPAVARGNVGYNPVGSLAAPAVPASGTAQTNTLGVDATVFVTGGTVSAVAIGGTNTGLTSGTFRVPAGQTITLTYSVAPTWTWFGD